jgi:hypothetical protein
VSDEHAPDSKSGHVAKSWKKRARRMAAEATSIADDKQARDKRQL